MQIQGEIPRRSTRPNEVEWRDLLESAHPVIIESLFAEWPALLKWTSEFFSCNFGNVPVRYLKSSSHLHPDLTGHGFERARPVHGTLSNYLRLIGSEAEEQLHSHYYLTGDGKTTSLVFRGQKHELLGQLLDDVSFPSGLTPDSVQSVGLWISASNTTSWLHFDTQGQHNLNVQVAGEKIVTLVSPDQFACMYTFPSRRGRAFNFSQVNLSNVDQEIFPMFQNAKALEGVLRPGDCLFLPAFWFHSFRGVQEFNCNVNFWWMAPTVEMTASSLHSSFLQLQEGYRKASNRADPKELPAECTTPADTDEFLQAIELQLLRVGSVQYF
jgi:hypothetical protein